MKTRLVPAVIFSVFMFPAFIDFTGNNDHAGKTDVSFQDKIAFGVSVDVFEFNVDSKIDYIIPFTSISYNVGNGFSTRNQGFTAPVTGLYHFDLALDGEINAVKSGILSISLNPHGKCNVSYSMVSSSYARTSFILSCDLRLKQGEMVIPTINQTTGMTKKFFGNNGERTRFSGHFVMSI